MGESTKEIDATCLDRHSRMVALCDFDNGDLDFSMNPSITVGGAEGLGVQSLCF